MIVWFPMRIIVLHDFLVQQCLQFREPGCQFVFIKVMLNKRGCFANRLVFFPGCTCCWIIDGESLDENEASWLEGIYDRRCDFSTFLFADVVKDRHGDDSIIIVGLEWNGPHIGNFTVTVV